MKREQSGFACPRCGSQLPMDSLFCQYCGASLKDLPRKAPLAEKKQKQKRKSTVSKGCKGALIAVGIVIVLLLAAFFYCKSTYDSAVTMLENGEYENVLITMDRLPLSDRQLPVHRAIAECGLLWKENWHERAAEAFMKIDHTLIPEKMLQQWQNRFYTEGVYAYSMHWIAVADACFTAADGYKNSEDYLLLLQCIRTDWDALSRSEAEAMCAKLTELLGLEDAGSLMMSDHALAVLFLEGRWETPPDAEGPAYYFEIAEGGMRCDHNLPGPSLLEDFSIRAGVISTHDRDGRVEKPFSVMVVDRDTIRVSGYEGVYALHRK